MKSDSVSSYFPLLENWQSMLNITPAFLSCITYLFNLFFLNSRLGNFDQSINCSNGVDPYFGVLIINTDLFSWPLVCIMNFPGRFLHFFDKKRIVRWEQLKSTILRLLFMTPPGGKNYQRKKEWFEGVWRLLMWRVPFKNVIFGSFTLVEVCI